ncbi:hypothetical protein KUTeg_006024 [Tegillarca granosa]|uniref:Chitin-binding type-2 domain-containing protein n=1 Tax=Tegillarca granosa TaxID=220873 RepID=A0ABQ9FFD2_TEGGR|nr:hypothetical protein KUTeg_006024 [Tegillarca granosa]
MPYDPPIMNFLCRSQPNLKLQHPTNCAKFYDCSKSGVTLTDRTGECPYPDLFSLVTKKCENFTSEYDGTKWPQNNAGKTCPDYHPSCVGLPDGENAVTGHEWTNWHVTCYQNRTINDSKCPTRIWHPINHICTEDIKPGEVPDFCKANPQAITHHPGNCAKYYNCSDPTQIMECVYPDLWSKSLNRCSEYDQNLCLPTNTSCVKCQKRLPSCIGKLDRKNGFPGKLWTRSYIECFRNRTMNISNCTVGEFFNPRLKVCMKQVPKVDVPDYCHAHPKAVIPERTNCAHYYNCSDLGNYGNQTKECIYPDLFSDQTMKCQPFENVTCDTRMEPQAPCKLINIFALSQYDQNQCKITDTKCTLCPTRLPSCIGKSDGKNPHPARLWLSDFIVCYKNRTIVDILDYCKAHPGDSIPDKDNCSKFYNCTELIASNTTNVNECKYPNLFSRSLKQCDKFQSVKCDTRMEPQAQCEYDQNICNGSDPNCLPCPKRLPSCRGLSDGDEPVKGEYWTSRYVTCLLNRTMAVRNCPHGANCTPCPKRLPSCVGHPDGNNAFPNRLWKSDYIKCYMNRTMDITNCTKVDVPDYCSANPADIVADPDNCSRYFNCSDTPTGVSVNDGVSVSVGNYSRECIYPSLFDSTKKKCENFTSNACDPNNNTCEPCPQRLPSCVGQADGQIEFPTKLWKRDYIQCFLNRTMTIEKCLINEYFNPRLKQCMDHVDTVDVPDYCHAHPKSVIPEGTNCAHYYNCSDLGNYGYQTKECIYPDLFSNQAMKCQPFENVTCDTRMEPQAPFVCFVSQYDQNQCKITDTKCTLCPTRLPSCIGTSDGKNPHPARLWLSDFIVCYKNRTIGVKNCNHGEYFHPRNKTCMTDVDKVDILDYCKAHPGDNIPDKNNCAKFYNCTELLMTNSTNVNECKYPNLFSRSLKQCDKFQSVKCDTRMEPQAPCEYDQNICNGSDPNCVPCPKRLPSCQGLSDGDEPVKGEYWTSRYITCLLNRTMAVRNCPHGAVFDPNQLHCVDKIPKGLELPAMIFLQTNHKQNLEIEISDFTEHSICCSHVELIIKIIFQWSHCTLNIYK